jgi:hypothetical protein
LEDRQLFSNFAIPTAVAGGAIFDPGRNRVYVPAGGSILRYDLSTQQALTPWANVGGTLGGGDITPDGKYLYVADGTRVAGSGMVKKITIDTGAVKNLPFTLNYDDAARNVVIADGKAWVGHVGQWGAIRSIDLTTDAYVPGGPNMYGGTVTRGKGRNLLWSSDYGSSPATGATYVAATDQWLQKWGAGTPFVAINPAGTEVAVGNGYVDSKFTPLRTLSAYTVPVGYDPNGSLVYALDDATDKVVAMDRLTGATKFSFAVDADVSTRWTAARAYTGAVSDDGRWLFLVGSASVRCYDLGPFKPAGTIAGTAFRDADSDAVRDAGEAGMANVRIYLDTDKDGIYGAGEKSVLTDASGNYKFTAVAPGTYQVRQVTPTGFGRTTPSAGYHSVTIYGTTAITGKLFGNALVGSISGRVFNDANNNKLRDVGELGLGLWRVFIDTDKDGVLDSTERSLLTDASGNWSFGGLLKGSYIVRVVQQSGTATTTPTAGAFTITLGVGQAITGILFGERSIA